MRDFSVVYLYNISKPIRHSILRTGGYLCNILSHTTKQTSLSTVMAENWSHFGTLPVWNISGPATRLSGPEEIPCCSRLSEISKTGKFLFRAGLIGCHAMALRGTIFLPSDIISLTLGGAFPAGGRKMKASI